MIPMLFAAVLPAFPLRQHSDHQKSQKLFKNLWISSDIYVNIVLHMMQII